MFSRPMHHKARFSSKSVATNITSVDKSGGKVLGLDVISGVSSAHVREHVTNGAVVFPIRCLESHKLAQIFRG